MALPVGAAAAETAGRGNVRMRVNVPGRQRWSVPEMFGKPRAADVLTGALRKIRGIKSVRVNSVTGSVLVHHGASLAAADIAPFCAALCTDLRERHPSPRDRPFPHDRESPRSMGGPRARRAPHPTAAGHNRTRHEVPATDPRDHRRCGRGRRPRARARQGTAQAPAGARRGRHRHGRRRTPCRVRGQGHLTRHRARAPLLIAFPAGDRRPPQTPSRPRLRSLRRVPARRGGLRALPRLDRAGADQGLVPAAARARPHRRLRATVVPRGRSGRGVRRRRRTVVRRERRVAQARPGRAARLAAWLSFHYQDRVAAD
ncbi:HMA2 domain-containing protein [Streptomyces sp. NPDC048710]|uniref:HMA2 domain-containing protein n=1 Tax=Streptomyces sp. NPDC048710 TaxID=3365586 RepID=UPI003723D6FC